MNQLEEIKARCEMAYHQLPDSAKLNGNIYSDCLLLLAHIEKLEKDEAIARAYEAAHSGAAAKIFELEEHIEKLEAENRWISVDERLPEHDTSVIVYYAGTIICGSYDRPLYGGTGFWELDLWGLVEAGVTHWMPLPKPPTVQGE